MERIALAVEGGFRLVAVAQDTTIERLVLGRADVEEHQPALCWIAKTDTASVVTHGQRHLEGAWFCSPRSIGDHHGIRCSRRSSRALE
jgi:hypothetical protein